MTRTGRGAVWCGIAALALVVATIATTLVLTRPPAPHDNPFVDRELYVDPQSSAAVAAALEPEAAAAVAFRGIAQTPAAIWLLPEAHPTSEIRTYVDAVQDDAGAALPVFVVYGIPSRDCGNFSAGGLEPAEYPAWVSAIAAGIAGREAVVILEPDALALAPECGTEADTTAYLRGAIAALQRPGTTVYLDGGHSNWLPVETMARLLVDAGVDEVRGFVTNTSNYNATALEHEYGNRLSAILGGAHFVVDTSRNGNGSSGEWCNPPGRALGDTPSAVVDGTALDATLWVKNPGESDGTCNGGPPAGQWWPQAALELTRGGS